MKILKRLSPILIILLLNGCVAHGKYGKGNDQTSFVLGALLAMLGILGVYYASTGKMLED